MSDGNNDYKARLSAAYFSSDEPIAVVLVPSGESVNWQTEPDGAIWIPERLFSRLKHLAAAYELHLLTTVDLTSATRFNHLQCQCISAELDFLGTITCDPLIADLIARIRPSIERCAREAGKLEAVIEGS
jgi:hypothetical protein